MCRCKQYRSVQARLFAAWADYDAGKITTRFFCIWVRVDLGYELTWVRVDRGYELTWYEMTLSTS